MPVVSFRINAVDNVATLLDDAVEGAEIEVRGEGDFRRVRALTSIHAGHKIALTQIPKGDRVVKYGFPIGEAVQPIAQGEWVHLQNCRSQYDATSSELDLQSGARKETNYG